MARQKAEKQTKEEILESLEKKYGVRKASMSELKVISTGSIQLNQAMKIGGTALGKIIELMGMESSGKSTIVLHQIAEYQQAFPDRKACLVDYEHSFDPDYAQSIGVDIENLLLYQPDTLEQGYDLILALVEKEIISCAVIDSQTAATPKAILEGEMSDNTISLQARLNSKFCLKIKGPLAIHGCTLFVISQLRDNVGAMGGEQTITTGGKAFRFYSDVRWKIWKMNDKDHEANKTTVDVIKSKIGKPFGQAKFQIVWGEGIDKIGEVLSYAEDFGIINRGGSWYSYGETKIGQGLENVKVMMEDNPEMYEEIHRKVLDKLKGEKKEEISIEQMLLEESDD